VYHRQYWVKSKIHPLVHPGSVALMQVLAQSVIEVLCCFRRFGHQIIEVPMKELWSCETVLTVGKWHWLVDVALLMKITQW